MQLPANHNVYDSQEAQYGVLLLVADGLSVAILPVFLNGGKESVPPCFTRLVFVIGTGIRVTEEGVVSSPETVVVFGVGHRTIKSLQEGRNTVRQGRH